MNLWLWIGIPLLFLLGVIVNAIKDMKRLEKQLPKYLDQVRPAPDDEEEEWPARSPQKPTDPRDTPPPGR